MTSKEVLETLKQKHLTIALAESITGGSLASDLVKNEGASKVLGLGLVTYSNNMKTELLNVPSETISKYGPVSKEVATMMATNVKKLANSDISVATTGNAGPTALDYTSVGDVFISIAYFDQVITYKLTIKEKDREKIISQTVKKTWQLLFQELKKL